MYWMRRKKENDKLQYMRNVLCKLQNQNYYTLVVEAIFTANPLDSGVGEVAAIQYLREYFLRSGTAGTEAI